MVCHVSHYIAFTFFFFFAIFAKHVSVCCSQFYLDRMILKNIKKMFLSLSLFLPVCQQNNRNTHGRREGKSQKQNTTHLSLRFASWIFPFKLSILRCKIERGRGAKEQTCVHRFLTPSICHWRSSTTPSTASVPHRCLLDRSNRSLIPGPSFYFLQMGRYKSSRVREFAIRPCPLYIYIYVYM